MSPSNIGEVDPKGKILFDVETVCENCGTTFRWKHNLVKHYKTCTDKIVWPGRI